MDDAFLLEDALALLEEDALFVPSEEEPLLPMILSTEESRTEVALSPIRSAMPN